MGSLESWGSLLGGFVTLGTASREGNPSTRTWLTMAGTMSVATGLYRLLFGPSHPDGPQEWSLVSSSGGASL